MGGCCVFKCKSRTEKKSSKENVSFHRLPLSNEKMLKQWLKLMRRDNWKPNKNSKICSIHFHPSCFGYNLERRRDELIPTAEPTIFPSFQKKAKSRLRPLKERLSFSEKNQSDTAPSPFEEHNEINEDTSEIAPFPTILTSSSFQVCRFILARPLSSSTKSKKEAFSFSCICPNCKIKFKSIIDKKDCLKHVVSESFKEVNNNELLILDFPEVLNSECCSSTANDPRPQETIMEVDERSVGNNVVMNPSEAILMFPYSDMISNPKPTKMSSACNTKTAANHSSVIQCQPHQSNRDSPRRKVLEARLHYKNRQLKNLRMKTYRATKHLASLRNIMISLKQSSLLTNDDLNELKEFGHLHRELLERQVKVVRNSKEKHVSEYGPALKTFALTLNYYSPVAYNYVRKCFNNVLPHPRTISGWYSNLDGNPGWSEESFITLKQKNQELLKNSKNLINGHIILDEMHIMKRIEYDGTKYYGYVDNGVEVVSNRVAGQALVFMFVSATEPWKIPLGYFLIDSLTGDKKETLMRQCLQLLHDSMTISLSVTFDGASTNGTMVTQFGCNFENPYNYNELKTSFTCPFSQREIFVFYDVCHMFKLVRNYLADLKILIDGEDGEICWKYFEDLLEVQEVEGLHLANRVKTHHVQFSNNKMKVKLATQLLSDSVAAAFKVLSKLSIKEFPESGPTIKFTQTFNKLFDVFNSKPKISVGLKKPLDSKSIEEIEAFLRETYTYITKLQHFVNTDPVIEDSNEYSNEKEQEREKSPVLVGNKKAGFLGFLISIKSVLEMYRYTTKNNLLSEMYTHRFCQDHIELFFGVIRQHGGHRRNPTSRQFQAAYKKCLVHLQLQATNTGNCSEGEAISILGSSSKKKAGINSELVAEQILEEEGEGGDNEDLILDFTNVDNVDHAYFFNPQELTAYSKVVVTYIAGSAIRKSCEILKCPACTEAMKHKPVEDFVVLIQEKDMGGLITPGENCRNLAFSCEQLIRQIMFNSGGHFIKPQYTTRKCVNILLKSFLEEDLKNIFPLLNTQVHNSEEISDHKIYLITVFCQAYFNVRLHHVSRKSIESADNKRNFYNKLSDFMGY